MIPTLLALLVVGIVAVGVATVGEAVAVVGVDVVKVGRVEEKVQEMLARRRGSLKLTSR